MGTWEERKTYVRSLVNREGKKQIKAGIDSQRENTFSFFLQDDTRTKQPVCRAMFAATLGMSEKTINNWLRERQTHDNPVRPDTKHPKSGKTKPFDEAEKNFLLDC
ncbi:hypothetical protein PoB_003568600 [Plakobranchus ocellatus]|uniref:Homeobox domain-containing protein n=1 Tax=Plakobranchus ocellatus TaxID=259542 RepID=A0AAV4ARH2_9GAST|nr:hypothetical protein PoB_003568600 [Plakobranchus ocellatus]